LRLIWYTSDSRRDGRLGILRLIVLPSPAWHQVSRYKSNLMQEQLGWWSSNLVESQHYPGCLEDALCGAPLGHWALGVSTRHRSDLGATVLRLHCDCIATQLPLLSPCLVRLFLRLMFVLSLIPSREGNQEQLKRCNKTIFLKCPKTKETEECQIDLLSFAFPLDYAGAIPDKTLKTGKGP